MIRLEKALLEEYDQILKQDEFKWYQKSRERWVKFGDRNTKFFHTQAVVIRKLNKIHGMFIEEEWCTESEALKVGAQACFTNMFSLDSQVCRNLVLEIRPASIPKKG